MARHRRHSKVALHLSKPWELGEALGWPSLPALVDRREGDRWLVELERPFRYRDAEYRYFVIAPRLEGWHLADADWLEVPCSMTALTSEMAASDHPCEANSPDIMVGSVTAS